MEYLKGNRHPAVEPERYGYPLEPGDVPMFNYGEDSGTVGEWWD